MKTIFTFGASLLLFLGLAAPAFAYYPHQGSYYPNNQNRYYQRPYYPQNNYQNYYQNYTYPNNNYSNYSYYNTPVYPVNYSYYNTYSTYTYPGYQVYYPQPYYQTGYYWGY